MPAPDRAALLLIDLQEAYFQSDELQALRGELVRTATALIEAAHGAGVPVVNVRTQHERDRSTWTLNMLADDEGFAFSGTDEAKPVAELRDLLDEVGAVDIVKTRDNSFIGTDLEALLDQWQVHELVVAGVSTHTCVATTVGHAYALGRRSHLVVDGIASDQPERHQPMVDQLVEEFRLRAVTTEEIVSQPWTPPAN